jgi:hypothetical protein
MRLRYLGVLALAVGLAVLAGWRIGLLHPACEQSCPAEGPCPTPPDCLRDQAFDWPAALVLGIIVAILVGGFGWLILRNRSDD